MIPLLKFSKSNGKLSNRLIFSLPAGYSCPHAGVCRTTADKTTGEVIGNREGWLCADCNWLECDRCDEKIYCDEDCTPYDVYQDHEPAEFSDGAYRVHYECLTDKEKEIMEANNQ